MSFKIKSMFDKKKGGAAPESAHDSLAPSEVSQQIEQHTDVVPNPY
jgi:hypothetical protein